ncbi:MAG TPA: hypothetical protein VGM88_31410 [Kofleriaceae bacterium]|jgi:hypothetical protein
MRSLAIAAGGFGLLVGGGVAWADGGGAPTSDLAACKGLPHGAKGVTLKDDAVVVGNKLAFPELDGGGCEVYSLAKGAKASGAFGDATSAVALTYGACAKESCPIAIATRDAHGTVIAAQRTDASCDHGVELRPIKLVPDHDDLMLICRQSAGAGWNESRMLIDLRDRRVVMFFSIGTGSQLALSAAERRAGAKPFCPIGSITVEKVDAAKPLLRVTDLESATITDGKGVVPGKQYSYDAAHHTLKPTGAPDVPIPVDAALACKGR